VEARCDVQSPNWPIRSIDAIFVHLRLAHVRPQKFDHSQGHSLHGWTCKFSDKHSERPGVRELLEAVSQ